MNDGPGPQVCYQSEHRLPVTDVDLVMHKAWQLPLEAHLIPPCVASGPKEHGPLVVVDSVNGVAKSRKARTNLSTNQPGRPRNKNSRHGVTSAILSPIAHR